MDFQKLFLSLPGMVLAIDDGLQVLCANESLAKTLGVPAERLEGMACDELMVAVGQESALGEDAAEQSREEVRSTLKDCLRDDNRALRSVPVHLKASEQSPRARLSLSLTTRRVEEPDGRCWLILFIEDVTRKARAEEALRRANEFQQVVLQTAATAVVTLDSEQRMIGVNEEFCSITGYSPAQVIGEPVQVLLRDPQDGPTRSLWLPLRSRIHRHEGCLFSVNGRILTVILNTGVIEDDSGRPTGWILSFVDVTELVEAREEANRAVSHAQRMARNAEEANRSKSEFLANMSHEIRTPMNGVLGMIDLLLDTRLDQEQKEYAKVVKQSAESLLTLINDILDFSKIEAGALELEPIAFGLRDCMKNSLVQMAYKASLSGLSLSCRVEPSLPDGLVGDPGRLRQIIVNLAGNSLKFTERGEIKVSVRELERAEDRILLQFTVSDTGIGIPVEKQEVIFESFSQADPSTTRKYGGTGLGLTICRRLVGMMEGEISVESPCADLPSPGEAYPGTSFHFTAWLHLQPASGRSNLLERPELPEGIHVLVIDNNRSSQEILVEILRHWNMDPQVYANGLEAMEHVEQAASRGSIYPLILLDANLPGLDGFQFVKRLRQNPLYSRATVLLFTAAGQRGEMARCRDLGISAYLSRPITQLDLHEAIQLALRPEEPEESESAAETIEQAGEGGREVVTRHTLREARENVRLLLAEDNEVNQRLALRMLQKNGFQPDIVSNGREAYEAYCREPYDLILMDVQMPEMDGFEATAAIRKREEEQGGHVPIIAMTAHAIAGYREKCIENGMDGYVSKPVRINLLLEAISELMPLVTEHRRTRAEQKPTERKEYIDLSAGTQQGQAESQAEDAPPQPEPQVLNHETALERVDQDQELLEELMGLFLTDAEERIEHLRVAMEALDMVTVSEEAHALKGAAANIGAERLQEAALHLEKDSTTLSPDRVAEEFGAVEEELEKVLESIQLQIQ